MRGEGFYLCACAILRDQDALIIPDEEAGGHQLAGSRLGYKSAL
jgi:hypothetical protein